MDLKLQLINCFFVLLSASFCVSNEVYTDDGITYTVLTGHEVTWYDAYRLCTETTGNSNDTKNKNLHKNNVQVLFLS